MIAAPLERGSRRNVSAFPQADIGMRSQGESQIAVSARRNVRYGFVGNMTADVTMRAYCLEASPAAYAATLP